MKEYILEPQPVKMTNTGQALRPFHLNGEEVYLLDMNSMLVEGEESEKEMDKFCTAVSNYIGKRITRDQLLEAIKNRKLIIGD
jgi:hypothetical protein